MKCRLASGLDWWYVVVGMRAGYYGVSLLGLASFATLCSRLEVSKKRDG